MMEKYMILIFVIIVFLISGCSSKSSESSASTLCSSGWNSCASYEDCHCWRKSG